MVRALLQGELKQQQLIKDEALAGFQLLLP